jgi:large subunit ribosomal protein L10
MPKPEKVERVAELKERIDGSAALLLTEYRGLTVSEISELRRSLAEGGASFAVVKNTLMRRAAADAGIADLEPLLTGPSAITFVDGDPVAAAKSVVKAQKLYPALVLKGAYMDGRVLSAVEAKSLADLESREAMLSKIAGLLKSDMSKAAALLVGAQSKFLGVLEAYKAKLPAEEPAAEPETAGPAAEAEVAEAEVAEAEVAEAETAEAEPSEAETVAVEEPAASTSDETTTDETTTDEAEASDEGKE